MNLRHLFCGTAVLLAFSGPAAAQAGGDALLRALSGCAGVADGPARLACYDRLAPQVKAALAAPAPAVAATPAAPAQPAAVAAKQAPAKEEQESWFGFDMGDLFGSSPKTQTTPAEFGSEQTAAAQKKARTQEIDSITAGLTDYAMTPFGKFVVFLDNGQIWRQIQGDSDVAHFRRNAKDNKVEISRGLLGSYNLQIVGSERTYKVERVK